MRRLHGPQRVRGDSRARYGDQAVESGTSRAHGRQDGGPDGAGHSAGSQREAQYVFDKNVAQKLSDIRRSEAEEKARKKAPAAL